MNTHTSCNLQNHYNDIIPVLACLSFYSACYQEATGSDGKEFKKLQIKEKEKKEREGE